MNLTSKVTIVIVALMVASCSINKKANKAFELGRFQNTIDMYNKVLEKNPNDAEANFYVADSYRQSNRMFESAPYYERAILNGVKNDSIQLYYAFALKSRGQYDQAKQQLEQYLKTVTDEKLSARASEEFDNLNHLEELKEKKNYFKVKNLKAINSPAAEYAPVYSDGEF